ncbi:MAG: pentapeptide repeat-containing protein [Clostridium sp.]
MNEFKINCSKCSGLCCTALFFAKMDGFPENKPSGKPCSKLEKNYKCRIHKDLKKQKLKGCIGYDCFGAGEYVTSTLYKGKTWSDDKDISGEIFDVFINVFQLFQIRYYLEVAKLEGLSKSMNDRIEKLIEDNKDKCKNSPKNILTIDIEEHRNKANKVLRDIIEYLCNKKSNVNDYIGKNIKSRDMSNVDLSMKLLIATNFQGCKFHKTSFLGADTRDTNFSDCDLRGVIFLTQGQVNSSKGNSNTKLPKYLTKPITWQ